MAVRMKANQRNLGLCGHLRAARGVMYSVYQFGFMNWVQIMRLYSLYSGI